MQIEKTQSTEENSIQRYRDYCNTTALCLCQDMKALLTVHQFSQAFCRLESNCKQCKTHINSCQHPAFCSVMDLFEITVRSKTIAQTSQIVL